MKRILFTSLLISMCMNVCALEWPVDFASKYFPIGTKWTEVRIDTTKHKSWFRKEKGEWVPNYERVDYYVTEAHNLPSKYDNVMYRAVYCQRDGRPDSLCQFVTEDIAPNGAVDVYTNYPTSFENSEYTLNYWELDRIYLFDYPYKIGDGLASILARLHYVGTFPHKTYGMVTEIGEKDFGGVRPLQYMTLEGESADSPDTFCWINGIGVTSWLDGECILGPYGAYKSKYYMMEVGQRFQRAMLVHFERDGEVLYDVWPKPEEIPETEPSRYYPEGTTWTELVLDTLKYDSWFSKDGDRWVANFDTVTYCVKGQELYNQRIDNLVYVKKSDGLDSLIFHLQDYYEGGTNGNQLFVGTPYQGDLFYTPFYDFDWYEGKEIHWPQTWEYYLDLYWYEVYWYKYRESFGRNESISFGTIDKIREGDFGGIRPLAYVDLVAKLDYWPDHYYDYPVRMIQGIGVTTWNGPECIFGPHDVHLLRSYPDSCEEDSHHRSMLVHFERNGEVLYDAWPKPEDLTNEVKYVLAPEPENETPILFDLSGRRLEQKPTKGIYIQNGKVLVK